VLLAYALGLLFKRRRSSRDRISANIPEPVWQYVRQLAEALGQSEEETLSQATWYGLFVLARRRLQHARIAAHHRSSVEWIEFPGDKSDEEAWSEFLRSWNELRGD
jgi:hypothetical protein